MKNIISSYYHKGKKMTLEEFVSLTALADLEIKEWKKFKKLVKEEYEKNKSA